MSNRRIAYAYFDPSWNNRTQSILQLVRTEVEPLDYQLEMKEHLFCPSCYEHLTRVPADPSLSFMVDGKDALFRHLPIENAPYCNLRSGMMVGKKFNSQEEAAKAVEEGDVVVISGFMQERPQNNPRDPFDGDEQPLQTDFESIDGVEVDVPISRHNGESFKLPSKVTSIQSLCTNFRQNFYRDIHVVTPDGRALSYILGESLKDAREIIEENEIPSFYFGKVVRIKRFEHTSHVFLEHPKLAGNVDFKISASNSDLDARGITQENAINRILVFYGVIREVGAGYWSPNKTWGEIALLPAKYEDFLQSSYKKN